MDTDRKVLFTNEDIRKLLIPLMGEQLLALSLGFFDSLMVATCGEAAVSGVSLVDAVNVLIIQILSALATGGAVIAAQYIGREHYTHARRAAGQLMTVMATGSVALTILVLLSYRWLLSLIYGRIDADVRDAALVYFWISALSYPFLGIYNAGAALFRSMGNSRISMLTSLVMNIVNISGNALLIFGFGMGVRGAALATLFSRAVCAVIVVILLQKRGDKLRLRRETVLAFDVKIIRRILSIGIPSGIENGMFQIGKLMLSSMISSFGTVAITANAVAGNIVVMSNIPGSAVGQAMLTVIGQAVGYGDEEQAKRYGRLLNRLSFILVFAAQVTLLIIMRPALMLYHLSDDTYALTLRIMISCAVMAMFFWSGSFATPCILRAAGDARYTMIISTVSMWVFRIGSAVILAIYLNMGVMGVWYGMYIDWIFRLIMFFLRYRRGDWARIRTI